MKLLPMVELSTKHYWWKDHKAWTRTRTRTRIILVAKNQVEAIPNKLSGRGMIEIGTREVEMTTITNKGNN